MKTIFSVLGLVVLGLAILGTAVRAGVGIAHLMRHAARLCDPAERIVAAKDAMSPIFRLIGE